MPVNIQVNNLTEPLNASKLIMMIHMPNMALKFHVAFLGLLSTGKILDWIKWPR